MNDLISNLFSKGYNGNVNLKRIGQEIEFPPQAVEELIKCSTDPVYFISNYCYIISLDEGAVLFKLFDYQIRFINEIHNNNRVISMQPRQMGKCIQAETKYKIRNKKTGEIMEISAKEFHDLHNNDM